MSANKEHNSICARQLPSVEVPKWSNDMLIRRMMFVWWRLKMLTDSTLLIGAVARQGVGVIKQWFGKWNMKYCFPQIPQESCTQETQKSGISLTLRASSNAGKRYFTPNAGKQYFIPTKYCPTKTFKYVQQALNKMQEWGISSKNYYKMNTIYTVIYDRYYYLSVSLTPPLAKWRQT